MNDLMSMGVHRLWKRHFVATSNVRAGDRVLDLAGGTGDVAALLSDRVGERGSIVVGDINAAMLGVGRERMIDRGRVRGMDYAQLDAEKLPFANRLPRPTAAPSSMAVPMSITRLPSPTPARRR